MSDNKKTNKKAVDKNTVEKTPDKKTGDKKKLGKKEIFIIVFAAVALVAIVIGIVLGVLSNKEQSFDYNTANLSSYIRLDEKYYNGYDAKINIPEVSATDVDAKILKLLCENKTIPEGPVYPVKDVDISVGDIVNLYYRGYTMEDGVKTYFDGGCNFADTYTALEIGSGSFIPGFESGLIGENQTKYATLTKFEEGVVESADIISITYSVLYANGTSKRDQTVLIDLSDPTIDERWGEGFTEFFIGKKIDSGNVIATGGKSDPALNVPAVSGSTKGDDSYFDITIKLACRVSDGNKLIVDGQFPTNYKAEDLAGKTGYFEVYIVSVKDYDAPELNDAFITDTLKVSADDLAKYEGDNLVEKYKKLVEEELNAARDEQVFAAVENAFWEQVIKNADFKKLPEVEVDKHVNSSISEITAMFESGYASYYNNDFDAFARAYLDLSSNADWKAELRKNAEASVKQRLVFYYIVREENLEPSDAEYKEIYDEIYAEYVQDYLDYYKITEESENYEEKLEEAKGVLDGYGDAYWRELVIYEYAMEKIVANANVI